MPQRSAAEVRHRLSSILAGSSVAEFKWQWLSSAKYRFCAEKFIGFALESATRLDLRIDTLIWNTHDARHAIPNRDDAQNFARMYFHLLRVAMKRRSSADWQLFPDERNGMDWRTLQDCLSNVGALQRYFEHPLLNEAFSEDFFRVTSLSPVSSHSTPEGQLADLFAGMGAFSRKHAAKFKEFEAATTDQPSLFGEPAAPKLSNSEGERFRVIPYLADQCRSRKLGVSLRSKGYLVTRNPSNPINFWHYEPQHELDRAPTREPSG